MLNNSILISKLIIYLFKNKIANDEDEADGDDNDDIQVDVGNE